MSRGGDLLGRHKLFGTDRSDREVSKRIWFHVKHIEIECIECIEYVER